MKKTQKILYVSIFMNFILVLCVVVVFTKLGGVSYIENVFNPETEKEYSIFHEINSSVYGVLPKSDSEIVFVGDSLIHWGAWNELFNNVSIKNRGIPGDRSSDIVDIMDLITKDKPQKMFLMIGINDLNGNTPVEDIANNYNTIVNKMINDSPDTEIILLSVLPINNVSFDVNTTNDKISELNEKIKEIADKNNFIYVDLNKLFVDQDGQLKKDLTFDGVHINGDGYLIWKNAIGKYISK